MKTPLLTNLSSLIITPIDNINLRTKKIVDQKLMEDIVIDKTDLSVFNLKTQQLETIKLNKLNDKIHWYYLNDKLYKIIHTL